MARLRQVQRLIIACIVEMSLIFSIALAIFFVIPASSVYITFGRFLGPILSLVLIIAVSILVLVLCNREFMRFKNSLTKKKYSLFLKSRKKKIVGLILVSLSLSILLVSIFSFTSIVDAQRSSEKISAFVAKNIDENLKDYADNITVFLNDNLNCSYGKPEIIYKLNGLFVYGSFISSGIMGSLGIDRAEFILSQGWGACGEAAIVLHQVMHDSGYETRRGHFKGVDHEWAEVKNGSRWMIVDPWYIGNLVDIQNLKTEKPDFQHATGVEVQYFNSTVWLDASKEHGY